MKKLFTVLSIALLSISGAIKMNEAKAEGVRQTYEIYPTVQSIEYQEDSLNLAKNINIADLSDELDEATIEKAYDVVSLKPVLSKLTKSIKTNVTNLILATYESEYTTRIQEDLSYIANKIDAYYLEINNQNIIIVGKDTDAVFYGLSTLQYIFEQSNNSITCLKIKDYAQSELRGFIEGYYGIPWTPEERKELMRFGSRVKNNIYIYAPKDDVYHSTSWRSLYTPDDYKKLKEQVAVGVQSKTRFAWAIHPFMNKPMTPSTYANDLQIIKNKFEQIYEAGVRQFVVSADDINLYEFVPGSTTPDVPAHAKLHRNLLNDLSAWCKSKQDCYKLVFVPTVYHGTCEYSGEEYFQNLTEGLDDSVQIMWTGARVCSMMDNMIYDSFASYTNNKKPFIWMNWPVNDYAINYLMLGEGEVFNMKYENDEDVEFAGMVINPLQLAEASKISIFACGDYTWNTKGYNAHKNWLDSFKYIEGNKTQELIKIAEHLTTASKFKTKDDTDIEFKEAESMKPLIQAFKDALEGEQDITDSVNSLNAYLDNLLSNIESYLDGCSNSKLLVNIKPWVLALKYTALTVKQYLYLAIHEKDLSNEELRVQYDKAVALKEEMVGQVAPNLISGKYAIEDRPAYASRSVMTPFVRYLEDNIGDQICIKLGINTGVKFFGYDAIHDGALENIIDGNEETYCWFNSYSYVGNYVRIDLGEVKEIKDITVVFGNSNPDSSDIMNGLVQVSVDAKTWIDVGTTSGNRNVCDLRDNPVNGRFIRLYANVITERWCSIREVYINTIPSDQPMITYGNLGGIEKGKLENIIDGNENTYCWFTKSNEENGYIKIDYRVPQEVGDIRVTFGRPENPDGMGGETDSFVGELQYSNDGVNWTKIGELNSLIAAFDFRDNPITFRYLRMFSAEPQPKWACIRDIYLNAIGDTKPFIKYSGMNGIYEGELQNMVDNDLSTYCWFSSNVSENGYIFIDYRTVQQIGSVKLTFGKPGSNDKFVGELQYSNDGVNWTKIGGLNNLEELFDLRSSIIEARYLRLFAPTTQSGWVAVTEIQLNVLADNVPQYSTNKLELQIGTYLNLCDGDDSTYAHFSQGDGKNASITMNLNKETNINSIHFVQDDTNGSSDFMPRFSIYYSSDNKTWTQIGENEYADVFTLNLDLSGQNIKAQYIKITSNWTLTRWVMIKEFTVN